MPAKKKRTPGRIAAQNRKARRDYSIGETYEAGIMLKGTEVKSLRQGRASIGEAYAADRGGELYLNNAYIPEYSAAGSATHEPRAARKLLMHKREVNRLLGEVHRKGMTLVPLSIYFNNRGIAKVELAVAQGRRHQDKRAAIKKRDWDRQKARLMRDKG
ncbi:MAG: SsrA-binding protein [Rhodospirillales bacterium RIFCSPLOWO2_01_FULL_65_14]|nr:MAG: SsrA-binding protein [Rhodospirillales bacterium RIFCSPLOWO2_01_FULL_65_14]